MDPGSLSDESRLVLAVETATRTLGLALLRGPSPIAVHRSCHDGAHSERLLPALDALLAESGCSLAEVGAHVVSIGPGSFTGLRIGLATVKGLAFGTGLPVAAVSTLAGIAAAAAGTEGPAVATLDARRGEVYAAVFARPGHEWQPETREQVVGVDGLAALLPERCTLVPGEGSEEVALEAARRRGAGVRVLPVASGEACALRLGRLGVRCLVAGGASMAETLVPRYVRRAEAEVKRTGRRFEGGAAF